MRVSRLDKLPQARPLPLAAAALWLVTSSAALAKDEPKGDASAAVATAPAPSAAAEPSATSALDAAQAPRPLEIPLTELPEPPPLALPDPAADDLKGLDALLERVSSSDASLRERAVQELLEVKPRWVSALCFRLDSIAERSDKEAMKATLESVRRKGKNSGDEDESKDKKKQGPDYLSLAVEHASPTKEGWKNLVRVLAISRMLGQVGTTPAARCIVRVYIRYGEFLRIDTQRQLEALGDRSLGALIETRRHPAQKIAQWAERQLDLTGKSIPSEAVQTEDQEALADVLLAFGRIRDPDSARIIISFAQSERAQIRTAARQAVVLLGDVGTWQLRDAYENTVGKLPPREWTWQRTARELFTEYDRLRQAKEYELFDAGTVARKKNDLDAMREKFDQVLAFNPLFERRDEMASGYVDYARENLEEKPELALSALRRAERITENDKERRTIQSLRRTLEARALLDKGLADQGLLNQALALDPHNRAAEQTLSDASAGGTPTLTSRARYLAAGLIAGVSLLGAGIIVLVALARRRSAAMRGPETTEAAEATQAPTESEQPGGTPEANSAPEPAEAPPLDEAPDAHPVETKPKDSEPTSEDDASVSDDSAGNDRGNP
jgi:hypothetical protein